MRTSLRDTAGFFKVLADEARLKMLWLLFHHPELCVCDIMAVLDITQSKASRHLGTLRHAGLVSDRKAGLWSYYSLCPIEDPLQRDQLRRLRANLAGRRDAAAVVAKLNDWMRSKNRSATCAKDGSTTAPPRRMGARIRRAQLVGGAR